MRRTLPAIVLSVVASLCTGGFGASTASADTGVPNGDVIANLWSWNWRSVASECVNQLDPAGYGAVWVAPPSESLKNPNGVWWDIYQPYSYKLNSRFGTQSDFTAMINTCHGAGIKVYTDAVINHTAAQTGVGYDGTTLTDKYDPVMYDRNEYNVDVCDHDIANWGDLWEVQNCELVDLPDLKTSLESVRSKLAGYLNSQVALGVDGFRVDAAKHIPVADLSNIVGRLRNTTSGARPYVFLEIASGQPPAPSDYFGAGDVLDFGYGDKLKSAFNGDIASLSSFSQGLLPAENAVSFVTNHDTERSGQHLSYKNGATAVLANVFQLAYKDTTPTVYAGFQFGNNDQAPPNSNGFVTDTNCASSAWYCLDRDQAVRGMVAFHNAVGSSPVANWQSPTSNVIGFGRGSTGFVAINNSGGAYTGSFTTGLANGTYCDVITACASGVTVSGGRATLTVPAKSAVAFVVGGTQNPPAGVTANYTVQATTVWGQNVFVVGNVPALGNWDPAAAVPLTTDASTYPRWNGTGPLPASTSIEYKFIIKQDGQPVIWETGANRTLNTPSNGAVTVDGGTFRR